MRKGVLTISAIAAAVSGGGVLAWSALDAQSSQVTGPKARYYMDAGTISGIGAMSPMAMMMGRGGGGEQHELTLRLGSSLSPTGGAPKADHFMPPAARLGASVPLRTPEQQPREDGTPGEFRRPKGRLLLFWGCGAHAAPGQPVVIDFARLAAGQMPPNLFSASVPADRGPRPSTSRTYGDWPNAQDPKARILKPGSSLLGAHRIAGNYSPEIAFSLTQDFMPPLRLSSTTAGDGSTPMSWNPVAGATGYYAWVMGGRDMGQGNADMVWWTSSARQEFGGGLWDWLSPETVVRLITQRVVMPPSQTSCTVPAEVKRAAGEAMISYMYAYGPEQNFAYPPRPANPRTPWNIEWTAKARFRSTAMTMLGMPGMGAMGDAGDGAGTDGSEQQRKRCKPSLGGMLGGMLGGKGC